VHSNKDFYSFAALYTYEALPMEYKAFPVDKYEVCFPIDYGGA
jgi:hypothetical protein